MSGFQGYSIEALSLLKALPTFSRADFQANKNSWKECLYQPSLELINDLGVELQSQISPGIRAEAKINGSLSPVHRDLRFTKNKKQIYKNHLLLNFWEGEPKKHASILRVRISVDTVGFAVGMAFSKQILTLWRERVATSSTGKPLDSLVTHHIETHNSHLAEPELKKPPTPFPADHARSQFLRSKNLQLRFRESSPPQVSSREFTGWCAEKLASFKDIHQWLITNVTL